MLTVCALISIALAQAHWATKLTDGVEIEVGEEAAIIEGELTTFKTITKPVFPADLLQDSSSNNEHDKTGGTQHWDGNSPVTI